MPDTLKFVDSIGAVYDPLIDEMGVAASNGWGNTDTGQPWAVTGTASNYSKSGGTGRHLHTAANVLANSNLSVGQTDTVVSVKLSWPVASAVGNNISRHICARYTDPSNYYVAILNLTTTGTITIQINKFVAGVLTTLAGPVTIGTGYVANEQWQAVFSCEVRQLRAKAYKVSSGDPGTWQVSDIDGALTTGSGAALLSRFEAGNTNTLPLTLEWDSFRAASPVTTRLDLNDDVTWGLNIEGTDFSPPPLNRAVAASLLADGESYPATAYANRTIRLQLELKTATVDLAAAQIQALVKELDRPTNVLMWKPGTTNPVFFRTFRAPAGAITELPGSGTFKRFDVEIPAEPFAVAPLISLPSFTLTQDGTAAQHSADISGILGDVETPLVVALQSSNFAVSTPMMLAMSRRASFTSVPFVDAGGVMNVSAPAVDATISTNTVVVNFATQTSLQPRAKFLMAGTEDASIRGRYRVFLRLSKANGTVHKVQVGTFYGIGVTGPVYLTNSADTELMVDMGDWSIPGGPDPLQIGDTGDDQPALLTPFWIYASRESGAGSLTIRYAMLIPVDDQSTVVTLPTVPSGTEYAVWDGANDTWYTRTAGGAVRQGAPIASAGASRLNVSPNVVNRLYLLASTIGNPQSIGPVTFDLHYQPRYLYVR